jgi:DNA-binding transcriptional regulator YdaS (Cro superfamily)
MKATIDLSTLSAATLRRAVTLLEEKEKLEAELHAIFCPTDKVRDSDKGWSVTMAVKPSGSNNHFKPRSKKTAKMLAIVEKAGKGGILVNDVAQRVKLKPTRVHSFLSKRVGHGIKRLAPGKYAVA